MKTCPWEKKILLSDSGELNEKEQDALERHLTQCASCRTFQEEYRELALGYAEAQAEHPMPETVKRHILAAAQNTHPRRGVLIHLPAGTHHALTALAALLLLSLAGLYAYRHLALRAPVTLADQTTTTEPTETLDPILPDDAWDEEWMELELSFALIDQEWQETDTAWLLDEETEIIANSLMEMETSS